MILALELCEETVVYGMVSDSYCRSAGRAREGGGAGEAGRRPGLTGGSGSRGARACGLPGGWGGWWRKGLSLWVWLDAISTLPVWPEARHATSASLL